MNKVHVQELEQDLEISPSSLRNNVGSVPLKNCVRRVRMGRHCVVERRGCLRLYNLRIHGNVDWPCKMANLSLVQEATES